KVLSLFSRTKGMRGRIALTPRRSTCVGPLPEGEGNGDGNRRSGRPSHLLIMNPKHSILPEVTPRAERMPAVCLRKGTAKPLHGGHPWVFADAIARIEGPKPAAGDEVRVLDERGACLGRGVYSPSSAIPVRIF